MNPRFLQCINSSKPVLVDFYADWCGPCKQMDPVLKQVKQELKGVKIVRVNVDKHPFIASNFHIHRIPTFMVFREGEPLWSGEGAFSAGELKEILSRWFARI
jgi:thioredoxin 1